MALEHTWCLPRTLSVEQIFKNVYVVQFCSTWIFLHDLWEKIALLKEQFCSTLSVSSWFMQNRFCRNLQTFGWSNKQKSLVRGAEMKNIVYALELQCNSCIYFSYLCWQVVPLWEMGRECCCSTSSDGICTPCREQACILPASILCILALLKLWMWSIFELFFAHYHRKAVLLESVPTEISNPNPIPTTYSFRVF